MMKLLKIAIWILIGSLVIIQFIPFQLPETTDANEHDLIQSGLVPEDVALILRTSCYDCHSNETRYPWYSYVAPTKWLVSKDIREGREEINLSDWDLLKVTDKIKVLDEMAEEVEDGNMPLPIYTVMHPKAALDEAQRNVFKDWTEQMMNDILGE
jgi:hypothetical protein